MIDFIKKIFAFIFVFFKKNENWYGWIPDRPDQRDKRYSYDKVSLPSKIDLRPQCPVIWDQKSLGSCTSHGSSFAFQFDAIKQKDEMANVQPSRLFVYYNTRVLEGTVGEDSGASVRNAIKSIINTGVCAETMWPYIIRKFARKPYLKCYREAKKHTGVLYQRINNNNLNDLKACLADGFPFVFGFSVYESFESDEVAKTGIVPMPNSNEKNLGGHCVAAVGYDDDKKVFIIRNSWGEDWGDKGYFYMPYEYLTNTNLADDFWTIRSIK